MVTYTSTSRPAQRVCMAERTEYTVVTDQRLANSRPHLSGSTRITWLSPIVLESASTSCWSAL